MVSIKRSQSGRFGRDQAGKLIFSLLSRTSCSILAGLLLVVVVLLYEFVAFDHHGNSGLLLQQVLAATNSTTGEQKAPPPPLVLDKDAWNEKTALSYVRSFKNFDRKLIFHHVPKTAGTAIEYAAGTKKIPWGSCLFNHKPKRDICQYPGKFECRLHPLSAMPWSDLLVTAHHFLLLHRLYLLLLFFQNTVQGPNMLAGGTCRPFCSLSPTRIPIRTRSCLG